MTRKERVLALLTAHRGEWVSGVTICLPQHGGSEGLRRVRELRAEGHNIDMRPHPDPEAARHLYRLNP